jgi:hypothetical protein
MELFQASAQQFSARKIQNKKQGALRPLASVAPLETDRSIFVGVAIPHQFKAHIDVRIPAQKFSVAAKDISLVG